MAYLIVQTIYWLSLATWFGGVLFVAVSAQVIFQTIREANPLLPNVLSVNLEGQHSSLLAGTIVGNILSMLGRVQAICGAVLALALISQWFVSNVGPWHALLGAIVRDALFVVAAILAVYDRRYVWPRIWMFRQEYIDHADEPEIANPAKDQFDRYHRESVTLLMVEIFCLMGMIMFSGLITPKVTFGF